MKIKQAGNDELTILAMMYRQLRTDAHYKELLSLKELVQQMSQFIDDDGWTAHLFFDGRQVVGYCLWQMRSDAIYIRQFWIMRSQRRQGLGRLFFDDLKNNLWGDQKLRLEVLYHNERAESFWKAVGFSPYAITLEWDPEE